MTTPDDYLRSLGKGLKPLPRAERKRIVDEMRSHLAERGDAAIEGLGPAELLASSFVEDYRMARSQALGPRIFVQAAKAVRGMFLLAVLWPFAGLLGLIGLVAANIAVSEIAKPDAFRVSYLPGACCPFEITGEPEPLPPGWVEAPSLKVELIGGAVAVIALGGALLILVLTLRHFVIRPIFDRLRAARLARMRAAGGYGSSRESTNG